MFVDKAKISIRAGDGGNGAVAFHREKFVAAGGPDGGDGGHGGDVIFVADTNISSLLSFRYRKRYFAENGQNGGGSNCTGKDGADLIIKVPKGTVVRDSESGRVMADLSGDESVVVAHGGKGGWGNSHFATATRQVPRFARPGYPGERFDVDMELKLLADVGLCGFPNVGKSTLISVVSAAKPEIANYHFTTLTPVLGVVRVDDNTSFVMADIPGLIEGASEGLGLGHQFLRHVERCRLIVHVVDVSGIEGRDPCDDFEKINLELRRFDEKLADRPMLVAGNKCDMATPEQIETFRRYVEERGYRFFPISAATRQGTEELVQVIAAELAKLPPIVRYEVEAPTEEERMAATRKNEFTIEKVDDVYVVHADWLANALTGVNMDDYESLQYFQRVLIQSGIIKKLEEMGVQQGDTVSVLDFEFEYVK